MAERTLERLQSRRLLLGRARSPRELPVGVLRAGYVELAPADQSSQELRASRGAAAVQGGDGPGQLVGRRGPMEQIHRRRPDEAGAGAALIVEVLRLGHEPEDGPRDVRAASLHP